LHPIAPGNTVNIYSSPVRLACFDIGVLTHTTNATTLIYLIHTDRLHKSSISSLFGTEFISYLSPTAVPLLARFSASLSSLASHSLSLSLSLSGWHVSARVKNPSIQWPPLSIEITSYYCQVPHTTRVLAVILAPSQSELFHRLPGCSGRENEEN